MGADLFLFFIIGGAIIGGIIGAVKYSRQQKKPDIWSLHNIKNGMTYRQVETELGSPATTTQDGEGMICTWNIVLNGTATMVTVTFCNGVVVSVERD